MIFDVSGVELIPGNNGRDCPGNGEHFDEAGNEIECCCDECDYFMCCLDTHDRKLCRTCTDDACPRAKGKRGWFAR